MGYVPHGGQRQFHGSDARFRVLSCGRRWGKSTSAAMEAVDALHEPNRIWIVSISYDMALKVYREVEDAMINRLHLQPIVHRSSKGDHFMQFSWGSEIQAKSADNPDSLIGEGLDLVILDEAARINRDIWELALLQGLNDRMGKAIFISTPKGMNWFYEKFEKGQDEEDPDWWSMYAPSWQNDYIFKSGLEIDDPLVQLMRQEMASEAAFRQEICAEFVTMQGRVYEGWERSIHAGKKVEYQPGQKVYIGWDFGYRHPAIILAHIDFINTAVYVFDEFYKPNTSIDDCIQWVKNHECYQDIEEICCDVAGNLTQSEGLTDVQRMRKAGLHRILYPRRPVDREIMGGVARCQMLVARRGRNTGLFVDLKRCPQFIKSIENYVFSEKEKDNMPLKDGIHDHIMDAFRYLIVMEFPDLVDIPARIVDSGSL